MAEPIKHMSLWDMLELAAERFSRALMDFTMMRHLFSQISTLSVGPGILDSKSIEGVLSSLDSIEAELEVLEASFTILAVQDLREQIRSGEFRSFILSERARDIERRLHDELRSVMLFLIDRRDAEYYAKADKYLNESTRNTFPAAIYDIEEAAKCLAFERYTASVFHAMRSAETVVADLAASLGATVSSKSGEMLSWGVIAGNIGDKIKEITNAPDRGRWHNAHMFLVSCNRAFRTKTAHPGTKYTKDEAKKILEATTAFIESSANLVGH